MRFFGVVEANGRVPTPIGVAADGTPIYRRPLPQGFLIAVEASPGLSRRPVATVTFNWDPLDPNVLPDLQMVASRNLGNGSAAVCDNVPGRLGGVPKVDPPSFGGSQAVADALNDLGCRFDARKRAGEACTVAGGTGEPLFVSPQSTVQFCTSPGVGSEIAFPAGDTRLTVRVRDINGHPGPPAGLIVRVE